MEHFIALSPTDQKEREIALSLQINSSNSGNIEQACEELVLMNYRLALWFVQRKCWAKDRDDEQDLLQTAYLALATVAPYFDHHRGRFSTIAIRRMEQELGEHLRLRRNKPILPSNANRALVAMERSGEFELDWWKPKVLAALSAKYGFDPDTMHDIIIMGVYGDVGLDQRRFNDDESGINHEAIADERAHTPELELIGYEETLEKVLPHILRMYYSFLHFKYSTKIKEEHRSMFKLRFGLGDAFGTCSFVPMKQADIGRRMGYSREWPRKVVQEIFELLQIDPDSFEHDRLIIEALLEVRTDFDLDEAVKIAKERLKK